MDDKTPIPIPASQRWREFRIQLIPVLFFLLLCLLVMLLWKQVHSPTAMVGEVVGTHYQVRSLVDGTIQELGVEPFASVSKGQVIGKVIPMGASLAASEMASEVATGEFERLRTALGLNRGYLEITALELQKQKTSADLEIAKADMPFRKAELDRYKELFQRDLNSKTLYDAAAGAYDKAKTTVDQLAGMVKTYEEQLRGYAESQKTLDKNVESGVVDDLIRAQTNAIAQLYRPVDLVAPADGVISTNLLRAGERVQAGESVVSIASTNLTYIIGYLRQPTTYVPNVDDEVEVRSRFTRHSGLARVLRIGAEYDTMDPILISADNTRVERALRVMVSIPDGVALRPGEFVDIAVVRK